MEISDINEFVEDTLINNYLKLAKVNLLTGEFEFSDRIKDLQDIDYSGITDIYSYMDKLVKSEKILEEYLPELSLFSNAEYVKNRIFSGEKQITYSYKRNVNGEYIWITFGIIVSKGFSKDYPYVLFSWRIVDTDTTTMVDAVSTLSEIYHKILKVNLTTGAYRAIKVDNAERRQFMDKLDNIFDWWNEFEKAGNIYESDAEVYRQFTDADELRQFFQAGGDRKGCKYRRKSGDEFRWVELELIRSMEYTKKNQIVILYVKDIHEEYVKNILHNKKMLDNFYRDALTLLYNRHKFNDDINNFKEAGCRQLTCVYIDANGLHELNNLLGHKKGDDMLCCVADTLRKYFSEDYIYRIGGDEFVVLCDSVSPEKTKTNIAKIKKELAADNYTIASGIATGINESDPAKIVTEAENAMREDKDRYYKSSGNSRHKRALNKELENLLTEKHDADSFLQVIAPNFTGVYFIDMENDSIRHLFMPEFFQSILANSDNKFSYSMKRYLESYVKAEDREKLAELLDYDILRKRLKNEPVLTISYQKTDGQYMSLSIFDFDKKSDNITETMWIFSNANASV